MMALWIAQRMMALIAAWSAAVSRWLGQDDEEDFERWENEQGVIPLAPRRSRAHHPSMQGRR